MARVHGSKTVVKIDSKDISTYTGDSQITRTRKTHETTGYGSDDERNGAGLRAAKVSLSGTYDSTAVTGPRAVLVPLYEAGTAVTFLRQPEGTGSGKPQDSCSVIVSSYQESNPVSDMIKWSAELTVDGAVTTTAQA